MKKSVSLYLLSLVLAVLFVLSSCMDLYQPPENDPELDDPITVQLDAPGGFSVLSWSATEIKLAWAEAPFAESYRIERAVLTQGETSLVWEELDETDELTYIDRILDDAEASVESAEYLNRYHYRVSACTSNEDYDESEPATEKAAMLFRAPDHVRAAYGSPAEYVQLTWEGSDGAEKYEIWRSESANGDPAEILGTVSDNEFKDSSVEQGVHYYYVVMAINVFENKSLPTKPVHAAVQLNTPDGLSVVSWSAMEIKLQWEEVTNAESYRIERAVLSQGQTSLVWADLDETYELTYIDRILDAGEASLESPEYQYTYHYRVSACTSDEDYGESEPSAEKAAMLFRAPNQVQATHGSSAEYVQLTWESSDGAVEYEIWRSDNESGNSAKILSTVSVNEFRDSSVVQGVYFYYSLIAINGFEKKSLPTNPVRGFAKEYGALDSPQNVRFTPGSGRGNSTDRITIEWDPVDHADDLDVYYAVYRYSDSDFSLIPLAKKNVTVQFTDVTPLPGEYYYYQVQAIVDAGEKQILGGMSGEDQYGPLQGFVLSPPDTVVAAINQNGSATVKWLPSLGSESEQRGYTYAVYLNGSMTTSGVSHAVDENGFVSETVNSIASVIKVTTINGGVESSPSIAASLEVPNVKAIDVAASQNLIIQQEDANENGVYPVKITWRKAPGSNITASFRVERSDGSGFSQINETALGVYGPFNNVYSYDAAAEIFTYIDRNSAAQAGEQYSYRVVSVCHDELGDFPSDECIGWGALSEAIDVKAIDVAASQHLFIQGEDANDNGVYPVKITWKKSPGGNIIASFRVERSDGSGFSQINETALGVNGPFNNVYFYDAAAEIFTYIDRNSTAQVGKQYSYRVVSIYLNESGNSPSDESIGWGALTHTRYMVEYNKVMNTALGRLNWMYRDPWSHITLGNPTGQQGTETRYSNYNNDGTSIGGRRRGSIYYNVATRILIPFTGAEITIRLTDYADFYIDDDPDKGFYFILNGNSDTLALSSTNGCMKGTMEITGMYPGRVSYGTGTTPNNGTGIIITGGEPKGGKYVVTPDGFPAKDVPWNQEGVFRAYSYFNAASYPDLPPYYIPWNEAPDCGEYGVYIEEKRAEILAEEQANPDFVNKKLPWYYWE